MTKLNQLLTTAGLVGLLFVSGWIGCASTRPTERPPVDEPLEDVAAPPEEIGKVSTASVYFQDDTDAGDDPFTAGCHWSYSDPACTDDKSFLSADGCYNKRDLWEWTLQKCHGPTGDVKRYDCERLCRAEGHATGICEPVAEVCDGRPSARCRCIDVRP